MDTYRTLLKAWEFKHLKHLVFCLKMRSDYYDGMFSFDGTSGDGVIIDGERYSSEAIIKLLADYYDDSNGDYFSNFGDFLYLSFTDLVDEESDILSILDEDAA